jgi:drug/metabolite transporter (DMT)-like permease
MAAAMATPRRDHVPRGIACMIGATALFAVSSAAAKWLVAVYPIGEVMFIRSLTALAICTAVILPVAGFSVFATRRPRDHIARGLSQSISQTCTVIAFWLMPLAGAIAINFSAPLFSALIAIVWLREQAGGARWTALLAGFFGVLVVTNPGIDSLTVGALFALANAVMYGSVTVAVRGMTKTESGNTLLMWQMVTIAFFHSFLPLFGFAWPTAGDTALLLLSGAAWAIGQYLWTQALLAAPATAVSPFYYLLLVWAMLIGYAVWGDVPSIDLLIGSGIVVASGLFLLWHEARRARPAGATAGRAPRRHSAGIAEPWCGGASIAAVATTDQAANVPSAAHLAMTSGTRSSGTGALNR